MSMFRRVRPIGATTGLIVAAAALLAGCGGDSEEKKSTSSPHNPAGSTAAGGAAGTIEIGDRMITFTTDVCLISGEETLVSGPGKEADSTPVYVDLDATSATEGEVRIDLGTDQKFSSSDEVLRAGNHNGDFAVETSGKEVRVTADFTEGGGTGLGAGTLAVTCN